MLLYVEPGIRGESPDSTGTQEQIYQEIFYETFTGFFETDSAAL